MKVRQLRIKNFRGVKNGLVNFTGHSLLLGGNNIGKSTICEALDLVLGIERLYRRPIVDEHDFYNGKYLGATGESNEIVIEAVLIDLSEEAARKFLGRTRPWNDRMGEFIDIEGAEPSDTDSQDTIRALPVTFIGRYDREEDDFVGNTFFSHPATEPNEEDKNKLGAGLEKFSRDHKRLCGFI